jgi:hypothetical protein
MTETSTTAGSPTSHGTALGDFLSKQRSQPRSRRSHPSSWTDARRCRAAVSQRHGSADPRSLAMHPRDRELRKCREPSSRDRRCRIPGVTVRWSGIGR